MRKRRICLSAVLGLSLALAVPGAAVAATGEQNVEAKFSPSKLDKKKFSKKGKLFTRTFISPDTIGTDPVTASTVFIDYDKNIKFNAKKIKKCKPEDIAGLDSAGATAACKKAKVGSGSATAFLGPGLSVSGPVDAFNGQKSGKNPTILLHSNAAVPITLVGTLINAPGKAYGKRLSVPVSISAGGPVPAGTGITDFSATVKKVTKFKKGGKKKKVSYVSARCKGSFKYQGTFMHTNGPTQVVSDTQSCKKK